MRKRPPCIKAIGYVRASTGRQVISPEDQREKITAYCTMAGLELVEIITEKGVSAKIALSKRPEGAKVAALLKSGICHIVALKLDRLFRNVVDARSMVDAWEKAGIHLHLVDMGGMTLNTGSSMGRLFLTMMAGFAEFERDVISERTTSALRYKRSNGQVYNGQTAYGLNAVDGVLVPNVNEQRVLERMRTLRSQGESYQGIANELNDEGVPAKLGGLWHPFAVQKILNQRESK